MGRVTQESYSLAGHPIADPLQIPTSNPPGNVVPSNDPDWDDEDKYWAQIDHNIPLQNSPEADGITDSSKRQHRAAQSRLALIQIVCILCTFPPGQ